MIRSFLSFIAIFIILVGVCCFLEDRVGLSFYGFDREAFKIFPKTEQQEKSTSQKTAGEKPVSDTLHVSLSSIYLISNGGRIDADCTSDYEIVIESRDNQNFNSYSRLIYTFPSKKEYMDALEYINQKGSRWILGHQFEKEYSLNSPHQITFEERNGTSIIVNNMWLNQIKKL